MKNNIPSQATPARASAISQNRIRAVIAYNARTVALMFASGTLIQGLLGIMGFSSRMIYIHSSLIQAANILTIILCSGYANRGQALIRRSAVTAIPTALMFLLYIPFAAQKADLKVFVCLAAIGAIQQIFVGLSTVCEYKIPYYVYRADEYGRMLAICGIVSSVASLLVGSLVTALTTKYNYVHIMIGGFVLSCALMLIVFITTILQKDISDGERTDAPSAAIRLRDVLCQPLFARLIPANIMRGFAAGAIGVLAATALEIGYGETLISAMVVAQSVSSLAACAILALKPKRIPYLAVMMIGCILVISTPLLLIKNSYLFLAVYSVVVFGRTLVDYAIPTLLRQAVPVDIAGPYNAWRMVLNNAGTVLATVLAAWMSVPCLLIVIAAAKIMSGVMYYTLIKKNAKH